MFRFVGRRDVRKNRLHIYALCVFSGFLMIFTRTNQPGTATGPQAQELHTSSTIPTDVPTYENVTCPSHYRTICDEYVCPKEKMFCYHGKRQSAMMSSSTQTQTQSLVAVQVNTLFSTEGEHSGLSRWASSFVDLNEDDPFAYDPKSKYSDRAIHLGMMDKKFDHFNKASRRGSKVAMNTLILGVGGGLAAHTINRLAPKARIDMVDLDPETIYAAKAWFCAPQREGIRYHIDDAYNFVKESRIKYDYTLIDIFQPAKDGAHVNPPVFVSESFFELLRRTTKDDGVAVMNMHPVTSEADRKEKERAALKYWRNVTFAPFVEKEKLSLAIAEQYLVIFKA